MPLQNPRENEIFHTFLDLIDMTEASRSKIADYALKSALILTKSQIGFLGFLNPEQTVMNCHAWSYSAMNACKINDISKKFLIQDAGIWAEAIRNKESYLLNDYHQSNGKKKGLPNGHVSIINLLSCPMLEDGKVRMLITVGNRPHDYQQRHIKILKLLMGATWTMIQRSEAHQLIKKTQQKFQIIADNTADWETWLLPDHSYEYISPSCHRISGYPPSQFKEHPKLFQSIIIPQDRQKWLDYIESKKAFSSSKSSKPTSSYNEIEFRLKKKSGQVIWVGYIANFLYTKDQGYLGYRESIRDITARKIEEAKVKELGKLIPICSMCRKIRDDKGYWESLEKYLKEHQNILFSHGICPDCARKYYDLNQEGDS